MSPALPRQNGEGGQGIDREGNIEEEEEEKQQRREQAARTIQRYYRGYVARKHVQHLRLESDARWENLVKLNEEKMYTKGQLENKNDVQSRWHRAAQAAARLQKGDGLYTSSFKPTESPVAECDPSQLSNKERKSRKATFWGSLSFGIGKERDENEGLGFHSKALERQHWLEMIDGKHRYGSNLKYYFRKWKEADTSDNFFRWLDKGDGKHLDLEELPRERLEKERITYLSVEQRFNYLIKVDKHGLLRWARNNELVDTAARRWKDTGNGQGIVPYDSADDSAEDNPPRSPKDPYAVPRRHHLYKIPKQSSTFSFSSDTYSAQSDLDDNEDTHYMNLDKKSEGWLDRGRKKITPGGVRKELLRKTVRRNTWIYVSDMKLNLFVGIKKSGTFQHSSFLAGGKVTSAGIIVVKHGLIKSLNPLSGHYRSTIDNFRWFIAQLEHKGADLSHVKIAKSVMSLWGLSKYTKFTKAQQNLVTHISRALHLSHESTEQEKSAELQKNAEREEKEHQERMQKVRSAEEDAKKLAAEEGDDEEEEMAKIREARRQILYGRKKVIERNEATEEE
ncbi:hypothetical protein L204_100871 [Cryptococcus depauperatus]